MPSDQIQKLAMDALERVEAMQLCVEEGEPFRAWEDFKDGAATMNELKPLLKAWMDAARDASESTEE